MTGRPIALWVLNNVSFALDHALLYFGNDLSHSAEQKTKIYVKNDKVEIYFFLHTYVFYYYFSLDFSMSSSRVLLLTVSKIFDKSNATKMVHLQGY